MLMRRLHVIVAGICTAFILSGAGLAQSAPAQWDYGFNPDGTAVATYPGIVVSAITQNPFTVSVLSKGAKCDGATDDAAAINAAITAVQDNGGGIVQIPVGTCVYKSTLEVTGGNVSIKGTNKGASHLYCETGATDCIYVHGASYASQLFGFQMEDLYLDHATKTGGYAVDLQYATRAYFKNIAISNPWSAFNIYVTNDVYMENVDVSGAQGGAGTCLFSWSAPGDGSARSDGLTLVNVTIDALYSGANGYCWSGAATTLNAFQVTALDTATGLLITNPSASTANFPQFGEFVNFNTDGASAIGCDIEAGAIMQFSNGNCTNTSGSSGQGSADTYALKIGADAGASYTNTIQFSNERIGLAKTGAAYVAGRDVQFTNVTFVPGETTPNNTYPALEIASGAQDIQVTGNKFWTWGSSNSWKNDVLVDAGALRVTVGGGNQFYSPGTRAVQWNATDTQSHASGNTYNINPAPVAASSVTITGNTTLSATTLVGGSLMLVGAPGSAYTATTDTAANLVAALPDAYPGKIIALDVVNVSGQTASFCGGTGVSINGIQSAGCYSIPVNTSKLLTFDFSNVSAGSEAVSVYG